jgi:hypothetical protein
METITFNEACKRLDRNEPVWVIDWRDRWICRLFEITPEDEVEFAKTPYDFFTNNPTEWIKEQSI